MQNVFTALIVLGCFLYAPLLLIDANAQDHDMWAGQAVKENLFTPHTDICDSSTEVFVAVNGGPNGFCIEKTRRSAQKWIQAKDTCGALGKRLPEPAEWQYSCVNPPSGYTVVHDSWEWASNRTTPVSLDGNPSGLVVPTLGYNTCYNSYSTMISRADFGTSDTPASTVFRCVR